jgi:acetate kinase
VRVLVLNAGSSTLKASVLDGESRDPLFATTLDWGADASRARSREADFEALLERLVVEGIPVGSIEAVGHRVVHGGTRYTEPVVVDDSVLAGLDELADLAPLHNPVATETIRAAMGALPGVPEVAAFDTAFHATLPPAEYLYPLPAAWVAAHGLRRYGFHGLSVAWSVTRAGELLGAPSDTLALVIAHLGSGCSVTAVAEGRSRSTSMGMTPLEGLMMGTRSGSVDPGILLRLLHAGVSPDDLGEGLEHASGLVAVADSADMRELLDRVAAGDSDAELAVEQFVRRAAQGIAAAATAVPRLDALVFTGGIGEHAAPIRGRIVGRLRTIGLDGTLSDADEDAVLTAGEVRPAVLRVEAREDLVIADATRSLVA